MRDIRNVMIRSITTRLSDAAEKGDEAFDDLLADIDEMITKYDLCQKEEP